MSDNGWIGVDLDGTLAEYDHWRGVEHIGKPIMPMVERVMGWLREGREVKIFTARVGGRDREDAEIARGYIQAWTQIVFGQRLEVVCCKDFNMVELWDDRAVQVVPNTGYSVGQMVGKALDTATKVCGDIDHMDLHDQLLVDLRNNGIDIS